MLQRGGIVHASGFDVMSSWPPDRGDMMAEEPETKLRGFILAFFPKANSSFWCLVLTEGSTEVVCLAQGPNNIELAFPR